MLPVLLLLPLFDSDVVAAADAAEDNIEAVASMLLHFPVPLCGLLYIDWPKHSRPAAAAIELELATRCDASRAAAAAAEAAAAAAIAAVDADDDDNDDADDVDEEADAVVADEEAAEWLTWWS